MRRVPRPGPAAAEGGHARPDGDRDVGERGVSAAGLPPGSLPRELPQRRGYPAPADYLPLHGTSYYFLSLKKIQF